MKRIWPIYLSFSFLLLFSISIQALTLEGQLNRSVKGVMHWLSCHCYNGLFILTDKNMLQPVCLPDNFETTCKNMKLKGEFREHTNNPGPTSPCMKQTRTIFFAESLECSQSENIQ